MVSVHEMVEIQVKIAISDAIKSIDREILFSRSLFNKHTNRLF